MLYNFLLCVSGDLSAMRQQPSAVMHETGLKLNVARGYLMEATGMAENDPRFAAQLHELLFAIEYYRGRWEFHQCLLMANVMQVKIPFITSLHGTTIRFVTGRMRLQRELITKALGGDESLRTQIAERGLYAVAGC
eukprot:4415508-Prymnesium_polylepis.1